MPFYCLGGLLFGSGRTDGPAGAATGAGAFAFGAPLDGGGGGTFSRIV